MVKDDSSPGKKIPLLKRWGRSFRQSFPSFRTGPGPNQAAANQKYIEDQLEEFVDSCRGDPGPGEGYFTPQEIREHANAEEWAHLGARPKNTHPQPTAPVINFETTDNTARREIQFAQQKNVLQNHAQSLFKEYSDTEEERRELLRQASTLLHEADPSLTPSNQKRISFHSQYWHARIHDIPEEELIFELQHHLEANGRVRMSDEHTRVSLLSLLALYPSLDTPAKLFEFLNLRTGYTPILPRSYDSSSDPAPAIDAPTPPIRTDVLRNTEERLVDVPTPDFAKPAPTLPKPNEFSPITTSDSNPDEEPPVKSTPTKRQTNSHLRLEPAHRFPIRRKTNLHPQDQPAPLFPTKRQNNPLHRVQPAVLTPHPPCLTTPCIQHQYPVLHAPRPRRHRRTERCPLHRCSPYTGREQTNRSRYKQGRSSIPTRRSLPDSWKLA
ncbi:hypothetical protein GHT06_006306 [Daphnia sinensis]|uniref:Uncharacterized protein n=1 Tax=Daphnia sinensis TaxID=1820382 RepID=A0AAD5KF39_9CRUS|nr:hypothetical protein GHT06_006306 [Daphnia sinensis]